MSAVLSAVAICERALRAIGQFPVTESAADGEQLREAMTWLDLIMGQMAGETRLFNFVPQTLSFTITNGVSNFNLNTAFGADLPVDQIQFPIEAFFFTPTGTSIVGLGSSIPGTIAVGQGVSNITGAQNVPPGATVAAINASAKQITLSGPSTVGANDTLQFATSPVTNLASTGTVNTTGQVAGTSTFRRRPLSLVTRDEFMARRDPAEIGHPRMAYIDRLPVPTLQFWPTPAATDSGLYLFELDVQTYAPNVAPAGVTGTQPQGAVQHKFRQAWQRWMVCQLSHDLGSGPIIKLSDTSLNRFGKMASEAKTALEAFENREQESTPPVCSAYDDYEYEVGGHGHDYRGRI